MNAPSRGRSIAGWVLVVLVSVMMILSASQKLLGMMPADILENVRKWGMEDKIKLIGIGELISGLLLLIPRTSSLGILLVSSYWGGAICIHMAHNESYALPAGLLVMSWVGAALRDPRVVGSFAGGPATTSGPPRSPEDA